MEKLGKGLSNLTSLTYLNIKFRTFYKINKSLNILSLANGFKGLNGG